MPLTKSDYSISEAMEMISARLPDEDPLTNITDTLHAGEVSAKLICSKTGLSHPIPAYVWKSGDGRFVWSPSTGLAHIHERLVSPRVGYSAKPTGRWNADGEFKPNRITGQVRIDRTQLNELLADVAPTITGGRKTATQSKAGQIIDSFLATPDSELSFKHGGLAAAARRLAEQFPDYKADTIAGIIRPDFRERKTRQNQ